jgi:hypothetical protein
MSDGRHHPPHLPPGFWGTYRSYLVGAAVLSVLAGVIGLMPLALFDAPRPGDGALAWALFVAVAGFPAACFAAPGLAFLAYRAERRALTIILLAAPLYLAAAVGLIWATLDVVCGGDLACRG